MDPLTIKNPFFESSFWISLFNSLVFRCNYLSFNLSSGVMSCLVHAFSNFVGAPLSLFKFFMKSLLVRGFVNSILAGLIDVDFIIPKQVHLNVSFPMTKEHKGTFFIFVFVILLSEIKHNHIACSLYTIINRFWYLCSYRYTNINSYFTIYIWLTIAINNWYWFFLVWQVLMIFLKTFNITFQRSYIWFYFVYFGCILLNMLTFNLTLSTLPLSRLLISS